MSEATSKSLDRQDIEAMSETRLADLLHELGSTRSALRGELARLEDSIGRLEIELARRGAGG
jgi:hypothetical protein